MFDHSGTEPEGNAMVGVPQAIASIITSSERFRPVDRHQQAVAPLRNAAFSGSPISPIISICLPSIIGRIAVS